MCTAIDESPNTVMRSYEFLQGLGIAYNKRGLGLFVAEDGFSKVKAYRKEQFVTQKLPEFFKNIYLLDIPIDEVSRQYEAFLSTQTVDKLNTDEHEDKH